MPCIVMEIPYKLLLLLLILYARGGFSSELLGHKLLCDGVSLFLLYFASPGVGQCELP